MIDPAPRRRPTIEDVARESGVSRGTVSRVLNGGHWVSADAQAAVERAIASTGFRANPHARSLATARAGSVAFLLTESHQSLFEDPNFAVLVQGAASALAERDLSLVLLMAGSADEQRRATDFIAAGHVDGALLVSTHGRRGGFLADLEAARVPLVACGVPLGFEDRMGYVAAADQDGAGLIVAHLQESGRTRIATITGPSDTSGGLDRLRGYREQLGDAFDPALVEEGDYTRASGERGMRAILDRNPGVDAVFAANDLMAAGAIDALRAAGRSVPGDVAVAGFDDSPIATSTEPQLTTVRLPFEQIAREMVRMLLEVIAGRPADRLILPVELVVRESA